jgi:hypothetical protein
MVRTDKPTLKHLSIDALDVELDDCAERPCAEDWAEVKAQQRFVIGEAFRPKSRFGCGYEPLVQVLIETDRRRTRETPDLAFLQLSVQVGLPFAE